MNIALIERKCVTLPMRGVLLAGLMACLPVLAKDSAIPMDEEEKQIATDCAALLDQANTRRAMHVVRVQLQAQGMKLVTQGCPFVRTGVGNMQQVLDVRVQVTDSDAAAHFVRGPLADGEEVDMGAVHLGMPGQVHQVHEVDQVQELGAAQQEEVSPDVLFNRQWLAGVMKARGLQTVQDHWWAFVPAATRN
jgi:D-alanyl-D-alanine dipeptidase